jgi:hypothetical protein
MKNYASAGNATIKYLFRYIYYRILFLLEKSGCYNEPPREAAREVDFLSQLAEERKGQAGGSVHCYLHYE